MEALNYNMPDADDALAVVIYMCTDVMWEPETYRGIAVGSSEIDLLRLYPDDLYYLDKGEASGDNEIYQRNKDFDSAYERRYVYGGASDFENSNCQGFRTMSAMRMPLTQIPIWSTIWKRSANLKREIIPCFTGKGWLNIWLITRCTHGKAPRPL